MPSHLAVLSHICGFKKLRTHRATCVLRSQSGEIKHPSLTPSPQSCGAIHSLVLSSTLPIAGHPCFIDVQHQQHSRRQRWHTVRMEGKEQGGWVSRVERPRGTLIGNRAEKRGDRRGVIEIEADRAGRDGRVGTVGHFTGCDDEHSERDGGKCGTFKPTRVCDTLVVRLVPEVCIFNGPLRTRCGLAPKSRRVFRHLVRQPSHVWMAMGDHRTDRSRTRAEMRAVARTPRLMYCHQPWQ